MCLPSANGQRAAGPQADAAKLIGRTILLAAAARPGGQAAGQLVEGIGAFAAGVAHASAGEGWLWEVAVLWLADTVNILSTYLSAPADLPLPDAAERLIARAPALAEFLDRTTAYLMGATQERALWERLLSVTATAVAG
ncbi:hypothetical protein [Streptomyces sp. NBC_01497]|uniref:hypothetical protein n=1 Tax=Streptomyces sp. NBC_01497 TaxID=2903885 RepID=UPI002E3197DC|nr:hypothetical protein [Streptomyces sp. NBC_01497]